MHVKKTDFIYDDDGVLVSRVCTTCKVMKSAREFRTNRSSIRGVNSYCRDCANERNRAYRTTENGRRRTWLADVKRRYNVSGEEAEAIVRKRMGKCEICGDRSTVIHKGVVRNLAIDHDHQTGHIRGVLCNACNLGLGSFRDNEELLIKAAQYLNSYRRN